MRSPRERPLACAIKEPLGGASIGPNSRSSRNISTDGQNHSACSLWRGSGKLLLRPGSERKPDLDRPARRAIGRSRQRRRRVWPFPRSSFPPQSLASAPPGERRRAQAVIRHKDLCAFCLHDFSRPPGGPSSSCGEGTFVVRQGRHRRDADFRGYQGSAQNSAAIPGFRREQIDGREGTRGVPEPSLR